MLASNVSGTGVSAVGDEWRPATQHLVEDNGERVDIASRPDLMALGLLGRQVRSGTHDHPIFDGEIGFGAGVQRLGDAEIGKLDLAFVGDEDVAGLDVHVDHALAVRGIESSSDVDRNLCGTIGFELTFIAKDLGQALTIDVLHDDERRTFVFALVEHADDVLVVQACNDLGLLAEALDERFVLGERLVQNLDCDRTIQ